jgi:hypothetical protein
MLDVGLSIIFWDIGHMHLGFSPCLLGKLINDLISLLIRRWEENWWNIAQIYFGKTLWNGRNCNEENGKNKSHILLLNAKFLITNANKIHFHLLMVMSKTSTMRNWKGVSWIQV